jgi:hypothetical protein
MASAVHCTDQPLYSLSTTPVTDKCELMTVGVNSVWVIAWGSDKSAVLHIAFSASLQLLYGANSPFLSRE